MRSTIQYGGGNVAAIEAPSTPAPMPGGRIMGHHPLDGGMGGGSNNPSITTSSGLERSNFGAGSGGGGGSGGITVFRREPLLFGGGQQQRLGQQQQQQQQSQRQQQQQQHEQDHRLSGGGGGGGDSGGSGGGGSSGGGGDGGDSQLEGGKENGGGTSAAGGQRAPFTMHGVLHYLQHEWSRYEAERTQWELERAELRARIAFLVGERKGQENLKNDLIRRIKMLEFALRQERAKSKRLARVARAAAANANASNNGGDAVLAMDGDDGGEDEEDADNLEAEPMDTPGLNTTDPLDTSVPMDVDVTETAGEMVPRREVGGGGGGPQIPAERKDTAVLGPQGAAGQQVNSSSNGGNGPVWRDARALLRQYLFEIGCSDKLLDISAFRVRNLLTGFTPDGGGVGGVGGADGEGGRNASEKALLESEQAILDTAALIKQSRKRSSRGDVGGGRGGDDSDEDDSDEEEEEEDDDEDMPLGGRVGGKKKSSAQLDSDAIAALDEFSFLNKHQDEEEDEEDEGNRSPNKMPPAPTQQSQTQKVQTPQMTGKSKQLPPPPPPPPSSKSRISGGASGGKEGMKRAATTTSGSGGGGSADTAKRWGSPSLEQSKAEFKKTNEERKVAKFQQQQHQWRSFDTMGGGMQRGGDGGGAGAKSTAAQSKSPQGQEAVLLRMLGGSGSGGAKLVQAGPAAGKVASGGTPPRPSVPAALAQQGSRAMAPPPGGSEEEEPTTATIQSPSPGGKQAGGATGVVPPLSLKNFASQLEDATAAGGGTLDVNSALGLPPDNEEEDMRLAEEDLKEDFIGAVAATEFDEEQQLLANSQLHKWQVRYTLRSHYDSIRAMQFHPVESVLITASEDGTAKLWDLGSMGAGGGQASSSAKASAASVNTMDMEPIYTYRGHRGPILAMDITPTGEMCFTAGHDGSICCWLVPPASTVELYSTYEPSILQERIHDAHSDCIWSLNYHSSTNRLISASADGTIKLWELGVSQLEGMQSLVRSYGPPAHSGSDGSSRPRSIDIVSVDPQQLVYAYSGANCGILDLETGKSVLTFDMPTGTSSAGGGEVNKVLSHPTMPVTVVAGEDRCIRYFDNASGKMIHGAVAHVESISALAIDPNGLYLLSGSHDGSLRMWNMEKRICLQEIPAHRKKYDMSVMAVAFHPSRPLIGSAGADALAKVYGIGGGGGGRGGGANQLAASTTSAQEAPHHHHLWKGEQVNE